MPTVRKLAIVSNSTSVKLADLVPAASALQTQIIRDFAPACSSATRASPASSS